MLQVSTPSRICLFGEHQDYLGLDVIALAIDLRFSAAITPRHDQQIIIRIRDVQIDSLNAENTDERYQTYVIDLNKPVIYENNRDYLKSAVHVLIKHGYPISGADIRMDSTIPIGKGMCSSSTMIVALIKALLESAGHPDKDDPARIAYLGYEAEVLEFNEPGGMMDHCTSALGGLVHLSFASAMEYNKIDAQLPGCFILFDSLQQKDTTRILGQSKTPQIEALQTLETDGITSVRDFISDPDKTALLHKLDPFHAQKLRAAIENHRLFLKALGGLRSGIPPETLGALLSSHHAVLRDGLSISTPRIDAILDTAIQNGAWGGKINGSGGGGCCFAYAPVDKAEPIIQGVAKMGYPARLLHQDTGVRVDTR